MQKIPKNREANKQNHDLRSVFLRYEMFCFLKNFSNLFVESVEKQYGFCWGDMLVAFSPRFVHIPTRDAKQNSP